MAMWWYIDTYNPFHLPTVEQVRSMTSYSAPPLYRFLENVIFILLPAMWLGAFTMHAGAVVNYSLWVFAVLVDGAVFYWVGLIIATIRTRREALLGAKMRNTG
jgi:hypothetical protein